MKRTFTLIASIILLISASSVLSASMMDEFIDPEDGMFDVSHWLAERKGFFPIPIIITEPVLALASVPACCFCMTR